MSPHRIGGSAAPYVALTLAPGEAALGEPQRLLFMEAGIAMELPADGAAKAPFGLAGLLRRALALRPRAPLGTLFVNRAATPQGLAFAAALPGEIVPLDLHALGGSLCCRGDALLCAGAEVALAPAQEGSRPAGSEPFSMLRLGGHGSAFLQAGGSALRQLLAAGESLAVAPDCLLAWTPEVHYEFAFLATPLARLTGPGIVWLQTLPPARLAAALQATDERTRAPVGTTGPTGDQA
jgi:uncharacterized protein (AIM24 family)